MTVNFKTAPFSPRLTSRARAVRVKAWVRSDWSWMKTEIDTRERRELEFLITSKALAIPIEKNPTVLRSTVTEKPVLTASQGTKASVCSKLRHNFITSFWKMKIFMVIRAQHRLILLSLKK